MMFVPFDKNLVDSKQTEVANFTALLILKANAQKGIKINLSYPLRSKTDLGASYELLILLRSYLYSLLML